MSVTFIEIPKWMTLLCRWAVGSDTDLILMKIFRTKQIESLHGKTLVSEGIDANYMDMMNYAVFGLIKLTFRDDDAAE